MAKSMARNIGIWLLAAKKPERRVAARAPVKAPKP